MRDHNLRRIYEEEEDIDKPEAKMKPVTQDPI